MMNPLGFGFAVLATASLAVAGGGEGDKSKNEGTLDRLGSGNYQSNDVKVSAKPGGGITFDMGESFKLTMKNQMQFKWFYHSRENSNSQNSFQARRVRTAFSGHVHNEKIKYKLQTELVGAPSVKDAWVHWIFSEGDQSSFALRLGKTKTYFGREATGSSGKLEFVERSVVSKAFSDSRTVGAMLTGTYLEDNKLNWTLGAFNNDPAADSTAASENGTNVNSDGTANNELDYIATIRFDGNGDMGAESYAQGDLDRSEELRYSIGAGVHVGNHSAALGGGISDVETTAVNVNAAVKTNGWHFMGEWFMRTDDQQGGGTEADANGYYVQGSYTLAPSEEYGQWGFGLRYSGIKLDDAPILLTGTGLAGGSGDITHIEGVVSNYYKKHAMKTQIAYIFESIEPDGGVDSDNHLLELQFTLIF